MNFDFSDDLKALRDEARRFLRQRCPMTAVRRILEGPDPYDLGLWKEIAALGWTGAAIPEAFGGAGLGHLGLCVLAEELGSALAPTPFSSSIYLAAEAIMLAGSPAQKQTWLPKLASGEVIGTLAVAEGPAKIDPRKLRTSFRGGTLTGEKLPVPDGDVADLAVVAAQGERGPTLALVDLKGRGVGRQPLETIDPTRSQCAHRFRRRGRRGPGRGGHGGGVAAPGRGARGGAICLRAGGRRAKIAGDGARLCLATLRLCASDRLVSGDQAQACRRLCCNRARARQRLLWCLGAELKCRRAARSGRRRTDSANEAYFLAAKENIQVHGGMGFTWEFDCHLYYRRAKLLALALGSTRRWKERLILELEAANAPL
jgi:alkylation response protein AidB-like acyl-CoA dehydrogenase